MLFVLVRVKNHFQYTLTMSGEQNMSEGEESLDYGSGNCSLWMTWSELIGVSRDTPGGYIVRYISYIPGPCCLLCLQAECLPSTLVVLESLR